MHCERSFKQYMCLNIYIYIVFDKVDLEMVMHMIHVQHK